MKKLVELEIRKFGVKKYLIASLVIAIYAIFMIVMIGSTEPGDDSMFKGSAHILFLNGNMMVRLCFIIFAGSLLADMVIKDFKTGTIKVLFTYPIARKKIFFSKLLAAVCLMVFFMLLAEVLVVIGICISNNMFHMIDNTISAQMIIKVLPDILFTVISTIGISLIPLYFGMLKKSVNITIISSVIITALLNGGVGESTVESPGNLFSIAAIPIAMFLIGVGTAYLSFVNIDKFEV